MDYEVVIPAAEKDFNKLNHLLSSLHYLNPQPKKVHIVHNSEVLYILRLNDPWKVLYHNEKEVLDLNPTAAKMFRRPQWIYQQFLKLFQNITTTDDYLILDSDLIINRPLDLLDKDGKPKFFLGNDQHHTPYFKYSQDMFGFGREYDYSFISEIMLFKKSMTHRLLGEFYISLRHSSDYGFEYDRKYMELFFNTEGRENAIKELYNLTCIGATDNWIPADYEIYGNFIEKFYPDMYTKVKIKTLMKGRYINQPWQDEELEQYIEEMKGTDYDTFTAHTWI
jgi:hypothetical protein